MLLHTCAIYFLLLFLVTAVIIFVVSFIIVVVIIDVVASKFRPIIQFQLKWTDTVMLFSTIPAHPLQQDFVTSQSTDITCKIQDTMLPSLISSVIQIIPSQSGLNSALLHAPATTTDIPTCQASIQIP